MPEHMHLLLSEPRQGTLAAALKVAEARGVAALAAGRPPAQRGKSGRSAFCSVWGVEVPESFSVVYGTTEVVPFYESSESWGGDLTENDHPAKNARSGAPETRRFSNSCQDPKTGEIRSTL